MSLAHLDNKNILISGATGFVGQHLLKALETSGAKISCLVRKSSNRSSLPSNVQAFEVDLQSGQGLDAAFAGQDMFIHLASLLFGLDWQDYLQANVMASENLGVCIARHENIERVVFVSSLAASGPSAMSPGVSDFVQACPVSAYGWSKYMSEQVLTKYCASKLVTLRPPIIYGSGDQGLLPYFKAAQKGIIITPGYKRKFPVSIIHAKDMAEVIIKALQSNAQGIYHCNDGQEYTMQGFGQEIATKLGRKAFCLGMPLPVMGLSACLMSACAKLLKPLNLRPPSWNMDKYREARESGWLCQGTRIQEELGFQPEITLAKGLEEAIKGYKARGWL